MDYLASIVNYPEYKTEKDLMKEFEICHDIGFVKNITPTGMILPKRNTSLHYNAFLKAFYKSIHRLGGVCDVQTFHNQNLFLETPL